MHLSNEDVRIINEVRSYLDKNIPARLKIAELVNLSRLSRTKLTRGFNFLFQTPIHQYWLDLAMSYAKQQLERGTTKKAVAQSLGYANVKVFSRAYALHHGITPAQEAISDMKCA
ncbi:AraC family transcriptional regulator [Chitinophaga horti]|uniref:AraC family transcriptional regulator n=1 Tax=Chitinophaga horti TaxID=2920382 RepID=A0ABY6IXT7_9BACT|nr:AraC family transcriptional regulator [Chitinophaga horti]UYQ92202.1 AraC family transcriptional regulator [Chitinophaga horti]